MHDESAVDVDRLSGDLSRSFGRQEGDHVGNVLGRLPLSHWHDGLNFLRGPGFVIHAFCDGSLVVPRFPYGAIQRSLNHPGTNRVDTDSMLRQILGHALREVDVGRLACVL